jgi:hypothetical protein
MSKQTAQNPTPENENQTVAEQTTQNPAPENENQTGAEDTSATTDSEGFTIAVMVPVIHTFEDGTTETVYAVREFATKTAIQKAIDLTKLPEGTKFLRGKYLKAKVETKVVVTF